MSDELIIAIIAAMTTVTIATFGGAFGFWRWLQTQEERRREAVKARQLETNQHIEDVRDATWKRVKQQHQEDLEQLGRLQARVDHLEREFEDCQEKLKKNGIT